MISIETSIFRGLLYSEEYARKVFPYLDEVFFDGSHKILFNVYKDIFDKYNKIPTLEAIAITLQSENIADSDFESVLEIVEEVSKNATELPDIDWLIDETEEYCKDKAIYNAIYSSISILDGSDKKRDKHAIPELLDEALAISFDQSIGMDFFEDAEERYKLYTSDDARLEVPLEVLNIMTNGGFKKKSLVIALAFTNVGKSSLMCFLAGEYLKRGKNVLYISMEMSAELIHERVEANLFDVTTDQLKNMKYEDFMEKVKAIKAKTNGKLIVKDYPIGSAHAGHFRHLIKEIKQKKKFTPDIIFVDYINICASSRYKSMTGVNTYSYVKAIAEELRALGSEFDVPIFSATQTNRSGANDDSPDLTATSDSIGLPMTADFMFAITADDILRENNRQLFHLLKTRWGNKSKMKPMLVGIDFDKMRYYNVDNTGSGKPTVDEVKNTVGKNKPERKISSEAIDWG